MLSTGSLAADYRAITEGCGLLDRSERGKLALSGPGAKTFLQGQISNDVEALQPGQGCYAAFLTPKGKMLGDLRVLDASAELLLDTERTALQELFNMIRRFSIGYEVELHKRTVECGLFSLIGPRVDQVLFVEGLPQDEHAHLETEVPGVRAASGVRVRAIRTDVGVDLLCPAGDSETIADALRARGATPVAEEAAECLRIERGRPRYGLDLDDSVIPQEAGLNERAVSFTKGCYVGQETVARLYYRGKPNRHLRGLKLSGEAVSGSASRGDEVKLDERVVGRLGSVVDSPRFGAIALALIRREALPGTTVLVGADEASAEVVELPFRD